MKLPTLLPLSLLATTISATDTLSPSATRPAAIYLQPLTSPPRAPVLLAEIAVPLSPPSSSSDSPASAAAAADAQPEILSYHAPDLSDDDDGAATSLLRVGVYDPASKKWASSTSVAAAETFVKGYAPHFVVTVNNPRAAAAASGGDHRKEGEEGGEVIGVVVRGVAIDAGHTRDFGPQVEVVWVGKGRQPAVGKPVVVREGGQQVEEEEKTFVQRYWWALAIGAVLLLTGGGDGK